MIRNRISPAPPHATRGQLYVSPLAAPKNGDARVFERRSRKYVNRAFARSRKSRGIFGYAIAIVAMDRAVDRKVGILARWRDGRSVAAAGSPDTGIADAARMVPGSFCRCRWSASDLHGASRTGREECQLSEYSEGRERSGRHSFRTSCRTRKRRVRENREPQGSSLRRQEPGARRSGGAGTERPRPQGSTRGDRSCVETRSSRAQTSSAKQRLPVTQITNRTSSLIYAARALAAGCLFGELGELDVVEAGHDGRLTVKKWRLSARSSRFGTSTLAHIRNRDFFGTNRCVAGLCSGLWHSAPRQYGPTERQRRD